MLRDPETEIERERGQLRRKGRPKNVVVREPEELGYPREVPKPRRFLRRSLRSQG